MFLLGMPTSESGPDSDAIWIAKVVAIVNSVSNSTSFIAFDRPMFFLDLATCEGGLHAAIYRVQFFGSFKLNLNFGGNHWRLINDHKELHMFQHMCFNIWSLRFFIALIDLL